MEVATEGIYFIIYVTYIHICHLYYSYDHVFRVVVSALSHKGHKDSALQQQVVHQGQKPHCHRHPHGRLRTLPDVHNHCSRL